MKRRASRMVDSILYLAIALSAVLSIWIGAYYGAGYEVGYLVMGTIISLGTVFSLHARDFGHLRFWAVLAALFTVETALLAILFQSDFVDRLAKDRVMSRLMTFGIAGGEIFLNVWVLSGFRPRGHQRGRLKS